MHRRNELHEEADEDKRQPGGCRVSAPRLLAKHWNETRDQIRMEKSFSGHSRKDARHELG
jgi:hypothetical protein